MLAKQQKSQQLISFFKKQSVKPEYANPVLETKKSSPIKQSDKVFKIFSRPNITINDVFEFPGVKDYVSKNQLDDEVIEQAEIQVKYSGYIEKERNNADKLTRLEYVRIPANFDYNKIQSMSYEAREKLCSVQPQTVAQASRISVFHQMTSLFYWCIWEDKWLYFLHLFHVEQLTKHSNLYLTCRDHFLTGESFELVYNEIKIYL